MVLLYALMLAACSPDPGPVQPPPEVQPTAIEEPRPQGDRLWLTSTDGRATVTVDVDAWLGWTGEPRLGVRTVSSPESIELLARAGASRSLDGVAEVEVDDGVSDAGVLDLARRLSRAGYRAPGFRPRGTDGGWHPLTVGAPGLPAEAFQGAWRSAEAQGPDAPVRLASDAPSAPREPLENDTAPRGVPAWTESVGVGLKVDADLTRLDLDPPLTRLHPALAVGPIEVASGPHRDELLLEAVDLIWGAAELTGKRPGPMHVDVTVQGNAPPGSAASVSKRLRERR